MVETIEYGVATDPASGELVYEKAEEEVAKSEGLDWEYKETVTVVTTPAVQAGNRYGVRYEEALALECAYLRYQIKQLKGAV